MPTQTRLPKLRRHPEGVANKRITKRSLDIIQLIARYRFLPTSLISHLIAGDPDTTKTHLKTLYHTGLIGRFAFPRVSGNLHEFIHFVHAAAALRLLEDSGASVDPFAFETVRNNREKGYGELLSSGDIEERVGKLLFLKHEVMIARFHAMLELGCNHSQGRITVSRWEQGSHLYNSVKIQTSRGDVKLPHRPDALFSLRFRDRLEGQNESHFFYEADRKTMSAERMKDKMRAHFEFVVRQKLHTQKFGIPRIRAVLIETLDRHHADYLSKLAAHPDVCGPKPTGLFWLTPEELLTKADVGPKGRPIPRFLKVPDMIFEPRWVTSQQTKLLSLLD